MQKLLLYILGLFLAIGFISCKNTMPRPENKHILWKNEFKGNYVIHTDELEQLIPFSQRENSKPLKLPLTPRVWWYNFGHNIFDSTRVSQKMENTIGELNTLKSNSEYSLKKSQKLEQKINKQQTALDNHIGWFFNNIGEKQVFVSESDIEETAGKIQKYLFDIGFRDAEVKGDLIHSNNKKRNIARYSVSENQLYLVDSVEYVINDPIIEDLIHFTSTLQKIKKGDALNHQKAEAETIRLEQLLKNNGYYGFNKRYIIYGVSNPENSEILFKERKYGTLVFEILNPEDGRHIRYDLNSVSFKTYDSGRIQTSSLPDTTYIDGVAFIRQDISVPLKPIRRRITSLPGQHYNSAAIFETQRQISLFNQFSFAGSQITVRDSSLLDLEYLAPLQERYTFGISPGINNIYNDGNTFFGFGIPVSLTMRNAFKSLETIELSLRGSYEGQPAPIQTAENAIKGSLELGGNLNITFPTLLPYRPRVEQLNFMNPRTTIGIGYNYSEPFWGTRTNFKLTAGNALQINPNTALYFNFLDAYLINTNYANNPSGREFYNTLDSLQKVGNNLKITFDPQFVSSINFNLVYNNQDLRKPFSDSKFLRVFLETAGTTLNFNKNGEEIGFIEKLFPLSSGPDSTRAYFKFFKVNVDFRKNININPISSYAFRINMGIANPYGKNQSIPYEKSFFVGGSNSIRAWAPRSLGTGSSPVDTTAVGNTIPQPGDILLEGSLEYRVNLFRFAGNIQFATFLDAGNVWKWHPVLQPEKINKSNFDFTRFYKEIAVGTGFGIRWDLSFFLFRFDWGIKVIDPSRPAGDRFVLNKFSLRRHRPYGLNLNFGVGYPF